MVNFNNIFNDKLNSLSFKDSFFNSFNIIDIPTNRFNYIDSGYNSVFDSAELKVLFFKVVSVCIEGKNTKSVSIDKYFLFLGDDIELFKVVSYSGYNFDLSPVSLDLDFDSELAKINEIDLELKKDMSVSMIIDMIRRYLELTKCLGFAILDGSLDCRYAFENQLVSNAYIGFSKKSNFNKLLNKRGYIKLKENSVVAKLFDDAEHCFRIDYQGDINVVLSVLVDQSDNIFRGYPYGLILADKFAKVSEKEKEMLNMIMFLHSHDKQKFQSLLSQSNAHGIIDIINKK